MKKYSQQQDSMFKGVKPDTFAKANELRKNLTSAEKILWGYIRKKETLGYRFRRQHPCGNYILDFYNHQLGLCIEVDGNYHNSKRQINKDLEREEFLNFNHINVIRFTNEEILSDINNVLNKLKIEILNLEGT